jgi:hypothetical protein
MSQTVNDVRPERVFNLGDQVILEENGHKTVGRVFGYEYSDGKNVCGKPPRRWQGWFYWFREQGSDDECCIPENTLRRFML